MISSNRSLIEVGNGQNELQSSFRYTLKPPGFGTYFRLPHGPGARRRFFSLPNCISMVVRPMMFACFPRHSCGPLPYCMYSSSGRSSLTSSGSGKTLGSREAEI